MLYMLEEEWMMSQHGGRNEKSWIVIGKKKEVGLTF